MKAPNRLLVTKKIAENRPDLTALEVEKLYERTIYVLSCLIGYKFSITTHIDDDLVTLALALEPTKAGGR